MELFVHLFSLFCIAGIALTCIYNARDLTKKK